MELLTFDGLVQRMATAVRARASALIDLRVGGVLRALLEAQAGVGLWLQWLIVAVLYRTRAATSTGADLDSWMADFGRVRLPAQPASGLATFSRLAADRGAFIPAGLRVRTLDLSTVFAVATDAGHPLWQAAGAGYFIPPGVFAADLPLIAQAPGASGNVLPGALGLLMSPVADVDAVANAAPFTGGADAESDESFRDGFPDFMASLSRATAPAVETAARSVRQGLSVAVLDSRDPSGAFAPGQFLVVVDDGSEAPSAALRAQVYAAVDKVRGLGVRFAVQAPETVGASVAVTLELLDGADRQAAEASAARAIADHVAALGLGDRLRRSRLDQVAYNASADIDGATVILNGGAPEVGGGPIQRVRLQSLSVAAVNGA